MSERHWELFHKPKKQTDAERRSSQRAAFRQWYAENKIAFNAHRKRQRDAKKSEEQK